MDSLDYLNFLQLESNAGLARVLITGGAGFIANHLSDLLMFRWFNGLYMSENEMTFLNFHLKTNLDWQKLWS